MTITIGQGVSMGSGIYVGPESGPQARVTGTASTNTAQTWVAQGTSPTTVTSPAPVLGTSSGYFTGAAAAASMIKTTSPTPTFTNFGTGDFTYEFWINLQSIPTAKAQELFTTEVTGGSSIRMGNNGAGTTNINYISIFARGGADQNYAPYTWTTNTWIFMAIQRKGANISFWAGNQGDAAAQYIGGSLFYTSSAVGYNYANASTGGYLIGGYNGIARNANALINELCISNTARYATYNAPIPIPTSFFTVDQYTTLLMQFQGANGGTTFTNTTS